MTDEAPTQPKGKSLSPELRRHLLKRRQHIFDCLDDEYEEFLCEARNVLPSSASFTIFPYVVRVIWQAWHGSPPAFWQNDIPQLYAEISENVVSTEYIAPFWVNKELVHRTLSVWQPRYPKPLKPQSAVEMIVNVGRLPDIGVEI